MSNLTDTEQRICDLWDQITDAEPEISTERLLATISAQCGCDDGDVTDALVKGGIAQ